MHIPSLVNKLLSPFSEIGNFFKQGSVLALSSIATGLNSFAILFFGSRHIETRDFAFFLVYWVAFNTILLTIVGPLDLLIPKLFPRLKSEGADDSEILKYLLRLAMISGTATGFFLIPYLFSIQVNQASIYVSLVLCAFTVNLFHALRIFFTVISRVKHVFLLSIFVSGFSITFLTILSFTDNLTSIRLIQIVTASHLIGVIALLLINVLVGRVDEKQSNTVKIHQPKVTFRFVEYLQVLVITFVQLILASGVIMFSTQLSIEPSLVVTWVAIASLVRIPLLILNSFTPPLVNRASIHYHNGRLSAAKRLFKSSFGTYSLASMAIVIGASCLAPLFIPIFLGSRYSADSFTSFLVSVSEILVALIVLPRVFLVVRGEAIALIKILSMGLGAFLIVTMLPMNSLVKLFLAPTLSSLLILMVSYWYIAVKRVTTN